MIIPAGYTQAYAFTVTLRPRLFTEPAEVQYDITNLPIREKLHHISGNFTVIAEMTANKNIHYHGIIVYPTGYCRDVIKHFKDYFRKDKMFGFVDIKIMDDEGGWIEYISKELQITASVVQRRPILFDALDAFPTDHFVLYGIL